MYDEASAYYIFRKEKTKNLVPNISLCAKNKMQAFKRYIIYSTYNKYIKVICKFYVKYNMVKL